MVVEEKVYTNPVEQAIEEMGMDMQPLAALPRVQRPKLNRPARRRAAKEEAKAPLAKSYTLAPAAIDELKAAFSAFQTAQNNLNLAQQFVSSLMRALGLDPNKVYKFGTEGTLIEN